MLAIQHKKGAGRRRSEVSQGPVVLIWREENPDVKRGHALITMSKGYVIHMCLKLSIA